MKRLLAIALVLIVVLSACGEPDLAQTSVPDDEASPSARATATIAILDLVFGGSVPAEPKAAETAVVASGGSAPTPYPTPPPLPEVMSCEQGADVMIELVQIWLDALVDVPPEIALSVAAEAPPPNFQLLGDQLEAQGRELGEQSARVGCTDDELDRLFLDRSDRLIANNPNAEYVLSLLVFLIAADLAESTPSPRRVRIEVDWTVTTCEEAADVVIERTQVLLLDAVVGKTVAEMEDREEPPESFGQWIREFFQLQSELPAIGCTEDEVTALVGERLDSLASQGEAAEVLVTAIRHAVASNRLFDGFVQRKSE